jgi:hypothetical protein
MNELLTEFNENKGMWIIITIVCAIFTGIIFMAIVK